MSKYASGPRFQGSRAVGVVLKTGFVAMAATLLSQATALAQPPAGLAPTGQGTVKLGAKPKSSPINGTNPNDIVQRLEVRNRFSSREEGGQGNVLDLIYDMTPYDGVALRFQAPLVYNDPQFGNSESGLGDVRLRPLVKIFDDNYAAVSGYAEAKFATATDPLLRESNSGRNDLAVGAFGSYEFTKDLVGVVEVQQVVSSFGGDEATPRNDRTTIRPFAVVGLPDGWWLQAETEYNRTWVEANEDEEVFLRGQVGWKFGANEAAYAGLSTQTAGDNPTDVGIELGARYIY